MQLSFVVDIRNRKLLNNVAGGADISLPVFFKEDTVKVRFALVEPRYQYENPYSFIDHSSQSIKMAIGGIDDPAALTSTWTKHSTSTEILPWLGNFNLIFYNTNGLNDPVHSAYWFEGELDLNTTEMNALFSGGATSVDKLFEIEVTEGSSRATVIQEACTVRADVIQDSSLSPSSYAPPSALVSNLMSVLNDTNTIDVTQDGDTIDLEIQGLESTTLVAGKYIKVNSGATGFELTDSTAASPIGMDGLSDADTTTSAPTSGDHLKFDGSNWVPDSAAITHTHSVDDLTDADTTTSAPTSGQVLAWDGSNWTPATNTAPNLFETVQGDSGTTTADSTTDTLTVQGGEGIDTSVSGDVVTVAGENATTTNKGVASFSTDDFSVSTGHVSLKSISIANGGTGQSTAEDGFDALAPTTTAGDLIQHTGSDNARLGIGTAGQVLTVNSGATAVEWAAASGGGGGASEAFKTISVSGQSDVVADASTDSLTLVESGGVTITTNAGTDTITISSADTNTTYTAGDGLDLSGTEFSADLKSAGGLKIDSTELALDVDGLTDVGTTTFGATTFGAGDYVAVADASDSNAPRKVKLPVELGMAVSDETTDLTTGTAKLTFRMPHAMTLTEVRANVNTAPVGSTLDVDINEGGSTILSTKITIDASEKTSTSAATPAVISDTALADDAEITIDIDQIGSSTAGKGLKIWLIGYR